MLRRINYKFSVSLSVPDPGVSCYLFEIGGKGKDFHQLKGAKNGFVAADGIEIGFGGKIPLYLFGFLY